MHCLGQLVMGGSNVLHLPDACVGKCRGYIRWTLTKLATYDVSNLLSSEKATFSMANCLTVVDMVGWCCNFRKVSRCRLRWLLSFVGMVVPTLLA